MAQVRITGWRRDAIKVGADKLIAEIAGVGLAEAKSAIDNVMGGDSVTISVASDELAVRLSDDLRAMNFDAFPY